MTMSRLADLYLHVGRTFEIASEQRAFDDVLQHFAQLADDALLLTRIGRSATLSLHSRHFSCVWFSLARHDASPDQDVRAAHFFTRPHGITLRDLITVFGQRHDVALRPETPARTVVSFDAFRIWHHSHLTLSAEFFGRSDAMRLDQTPTRVFFETLRLPRQEHARTGPAPHRGSGKSDASAA